MTATASAWPVPDLRSYLIGGWRIDRSLVDRRHSIDGKVSGDARFTAGGATLLYCERGELTFGNYAGPAEQAYRYEFPDGGARASVRFLDGRLFHELDLTRGHAAVSHKCAADVYEGRFVAIDGNYWRSEWRIVGPRKDQAILTVYTRIA